MASPTQATHTMEDTMRNLIRAAALLASTIGVAAGGVAFTSAPALASPVCNLDVVSITSWDLYSSNGDDSIKIELDNDMYGPWSMPDNWTRNASLGDVNKDYTNSVDVTLYHQGITRHLIDSDPVSCNILGNRTLELDGNDAIYRMVVNITER
jgi:hypothetical protein